MPQDKSLWNRKHDILTWQNILTCEDTRVLYSLPTAGTLLYKSTTNRNIEERNLMGFNSQQWNLNFNSQQRCWSCYCHTRLAVPVRRRNVSWSSRDRPAVRSKTCTPCVRRGTSLPAGCWAPTGRNGDSGRTDADRGNYSRGLRPVELCSHAPTHTGTTTWIHFRRAVTYVSNQVRGSSNKTIKRQTAIAQSKMTRDIKSSFRSVGQQFSYTRVAVHANGWLPRGVDDTLLPTKPRKDRAPLKINNLNLGRHFEYLLWLWTAFYVLAYLIIIGLTTELLYE